MVPSVAEESLGNWSVTFFGQMLALMGNNGVRMESIFVKEHVHGRR